jgi:hypothetical protein
MAAGQSQCQSRGEQQSARADRHHFVVVDVVVVELVTPPVPLVVPVAPGVLPDDVSVPLVLPGVPPVPEAPIELLPPVLPVPVVEPLAVVSVLDVLPVLPVAPAVVDGLVDGVEAVDGVVVVVEVVLSVLSFFVQAPSERAATIASAAAAVWVRDVFMVRETP